MKSRTHGAAAPRAAGNWLLAALAIATLLAPNIARSQAQQAVNLRSTAGFAVLAGSQISNVPTSAITGHIGLSPATGGNITGFGSAEITGTVYTVDASGPAGSVPAASMLTTAKGDLTLAYDDAAGRTPVPSGPFLNPGAGSGNIGGLTLGPGLYKFTSTVEITGSNLTLSGSATDVWIFQIASGLTVGSGIQVILAGGARAANIFWQVGTSAILGTTSVMKGTILADQSISLNTGASLEGRALASIAAVTLASSVITQPGAATSIAAASHRPRLAAIRNGRGHHLVFTVVSDGKTTLRLYSTQGREVAILFDGHATAGEQNATRPVPTTLSRGLYYAELESNGQIRTDRLFLGD